jgi:hypothetical protein
MITGTSWCARCDTFSTHILTGYNEPCKCHDGRGEWWECAPGQVCECGEPKRWMHQPPPEPLEWAIELPDTLRLSERAQAQP